MAGRYVGQWLAAAATGQRLRPVGVQVLGFVGLCGSSILVEVVGRVVVLTGWDVRQDSVFDDVCCLLSRLAVASV
jgi:hypothetical protein